MSIMQQNARMNYRSRMLVWIVISAAGVVTLADARADVVVGETRKIELSKQAAPTTDAVRASYRRPRSIPFPADNPYTLEKVVLGKKLYFDTRLSQANLL